VSEKERTTEVRTRCFLLSIFAIRLIAELPQAKKTTPPSASLRPEPPCLLMAWITASVKASQPIFECELASCALTVRAVFRQRTPSFCQASR
jgi:hypothetical protein